LGNEYGTGVPGPGLDLEATTGEEALRESRWSYIHPGETLREGFLAALGKSPAWLAEGLRLPPGEVVEVLAGDSLTSELAAIAPCPVPHHSGDESQEAMEAGRPVGASPASRQ
jgi:hypothetical protein